MEHLEKEVLEIEKSQIVVNAEGELQLLLVDNQGQVLKKLNNEGNIINLPVSYTYTNPPWKSK